MNKRRRFKAKRRRWLQKYCKRHGIGWPVFRAVLEVDMTAGTFRWVR